MKKILMNVLMVFTLLSLASCYNVKKSPFYDSEWFFENTDKNGAQYVHQLYFKPKGEVVIKAFYKDSPSALVWSGKYKINSKKIVFDIDSLVRTENDEAVARVVRTQMIKYFTGDFYYAIAEPGEECSSWRLELIRPKNFFYGKNLDFMGNPMETWQKVERTED